MQQQIAMGNSNCNGFGELKLYGFLILAISTATGHSGGNMHMLRQITSCVCPGHELVFECIIQGGVATTWQGTIFDSCTDNQNIVLRHSRFNSILNLSQNCSDTGMIFTRPISAINQKYHSQLSMIYSQQLNNKTVDCVKDENEELSKSHILLTTEQPLPPNVSLSSVGHGELVFSWSSIKFSQDCTASYYKINSSGCGKCSNTITFNNSVTCMLKSTASSQSCLLSVENVVCDNLHGAVSEPVSLLIQSLDNPLGIIIFEYITNSRFISRVFLEIYYSEKQLRNDIAYIVIYTNNSGNECNSETISSSSCAKGICSHTFDVYSSHCSHATKINVRVISTQMRDILTTVAGTALTTIILMVVLVVFLLIFLVKLYQNNHSKHHNQSALSSEESVRSQSITAHGSGSDVLSLDIHSLAKTCVENREIDDSQIHQNNTESALYSNSFHNVDEMLNLDTLLIEIRHQVTPKWYKFGVAVGINLETLNELSNLPPEESIVEILDLWLRSNKTAVTWRDVANALKDTGLYLLAEKILKVYKTGTTLARYSKFDGISPDTVLSMFAGKLPTAVEKEINPQDMPYLHDTEDQLPYSPCPENFATNEQDGGACPPLPPKECQCTSESMIGTACL